MEDKDLESRLYDKSYTCPVCDKKFKNKEIKKGKTIFVEMNLGLRGKFKPIMPDYYYVVMCDECGYAAISKTFNKITQKQAKKIREKVNPNYKPRKYHTIYDTNDVIDRYKVALYFCYLKDSTMSERGYICEKLAFLYAELNDEEKELKYNKYAYECYMEAYKKENLPIMGMEENQFVYTLAYLAYKIGNNDEARKFLSKIIVKRNLSTTLKEKVDDFVTILKLEKREDENKA